MKDMIHGSKLVLLAFTMLIIIIPYIGAQDWNSEDEAKCASTKTIITTTCSVVGSVGGLITKIADFVGAAADICGSLTGELLDCEQISARLAALQDDVTEVLETVKRIDATVGDLKTSIEVQNYIERFQLIDMVTTLQHWSFEYNRLLKSSENGGIVVTGNSRAIDWIDGVLDEVGKVNTALAQMLTGVDIFIDENNANIYEVAAKYNVCDLDLYVFVSGMIMETATMFLIATRLSNHRDLSEVDFHDVTAMLDFNTYIYRKACSFKDFSTRDIVDWNFNEKPLQLIARSSGSKEVDIQLFGENKNYLGEFSIFSSSNRGSREKPSFRLNNCREYQGYYGVTSEVRWKDLPVDHRERIWTIQFGDDYLLVHCGGERIWYKKLDGTCKSRYGDGKIKMIRPNWYATRMYYNAGYPMTSSVFLKYYEDSTWNMRYNDWLPVAKYTNYRWFIYRHPLSIKTRDGMESVKHLTVNFYRMIGDGSGKECSDKIEGCNVYTSSYFEFAPAVLCKDWTYLSNDECDIYSKVFTGHPLAEDMKDRCYNYAGLKDWYNMLKDSCSRACSRCYSEHDTFTSVTINTGSNPTFTIQGCVDNMPFEAEKVTQARNRNGAENVWTLEVDPVERAFLRIRFQGVEMVKFNFATDSTNRDQCVEHWTVPKDLGQMFMSYNMRDVEVKQEMMSVYSTFEETYKEDRDKFCSAAPGSAHWCNN